MDFILHSVDYKYNIYLYTYNICRVQFLGCGWPHGDLRAYKFAGHSWQLPRHPCHPPQQQRCKKSLLALSGASSKIRTCATIFKSAAAIFGSNSFFFLEFLHLIFGPNLRSSPHFTIQLSLAFCDLSLGLTNICWAVMTRLIFIVLNIIAALMITSVFQENIFLIKKWLNPLCKYLGVLLKESKVIFDFDKF